MTLAWPQGLVRELSGTSGLVYRGILWPLRPANILTQVMKTIFYLVFSFFVKRKHVPAR